MSVHTLFWLGFTLRLQMQNIIYCLEQMTAMFISRKCAENKAYTLFIVYKYESDIGTKFKTKLQSDLV